MSTGAEWVCFNDRTVNVALCAANSGAVGCTQCNPQPITGVPNNNRGVFCLELFLRAVFSDFPEISGNRKGGGVRNFCKSTKNKNGMKNENVFSKNLKTHSKNPDSFLARAFGARHSFHFSLFSARAIFPLVSNFFIGARLRRAHFFNFFLH